MAASYGINAISLFVMWKVMAEDGESKWHTVFGRVKGSACLQSLHIKTAWDIFKQQRSGLARSESTNAENWIRS